MKTNKISILLIFSLILMSSRCITEKERMEWLTVKNNLNETVYCVCSANDADTTLNFTTKKNILANKYVHLVESGQETKVHDCWICNQRTWDSVDTVILFVLSVKVLENNTWEEIISKNMVLRKYYLTEDYISKNGCRITIE